MTSTSKLIYTARLSCVQTVTNNAKCQRTCKNEQSEIISRWVGTDKVVGRYGMQSK